MPKRSPSLLRQRPKETPSNSQKRIAQESLDLLKLEKAAFAQGFRLVAGIDEAGRGPLAGPVVAAACLFKETLSFPGINDSKLLTPKKREQLFFEITEHPLVIYGVGIVSHEVIDQINILQATHRAMHQAVESLAM
ncbi:MAG: ribonuclease HII, partial [Chlamydiae bacterium]|nr:ribonuclease HII [Chlamydiota bacterium]